MKTKFEVIETPEYWLAVSDEEIKENKLVLEKYADDSYTNITTSTAMSALITNEYVIGFQKKIIGYQPKGNAPELDLPLLPKMVVEDDVEEFLLKRFPEDGKHDNRMWQAEGWKKCLKESKFKYTEENLRKAIEFGMFAPKVPSKFNELCEDFIQTLKQPKWFIAEIEQINNKPGASYGTTAKYKLKTTTKNGKTYLAGKYF